jgi:hypothetical protein
MVLINERQKPDVFGALLSALQKATTIAFCKAYRPTTA